MGVRERKGTIDGGGSGQGLLRRRIDGTALFGTGVYSNSSAKCFSSKTDSQLQMRMLGINGD